MKTREHLSEPSVNIPGVRHEYNIFYERFDQQIQIVIL